MAIDAGSLSGVQKATLLLTIAGGEALDLFKSFLLSPEGSEDFDKVLAQSETHCIPRKIETYERFLSHTRVQKEYEGIRDYIRLSV